MIVVDYIFMNPIKRQLNEYILSDTERKKQRKSIFDKNEAITCIEHLSNEILYEIFEYLDAYDLFNGFSYLNIRFNHLVNHSSLPIKFSFFATFNHIYDGHYEQFFRSNIHRIISLQIHDELYTLSLSRIFWINALFNRLESLTVGNIHEYTLMILLRNLTTLPRLFSLNIHMEAISINLIELYGLICCLPVLKYNKVSLSEPISYFSSFGSISYFPFSFKVDKFSTIEHLVIDRSCNTSDLFRILSYTPHLSYLKCDTLETNESLETELPLNTFNLKTVFFTKCNLSFDQFEILIKRYFSQIQTLRLSTSWDNSYLDADRWKRLILKYMPHLRIFIFKYSEVTYNQVTPSSYHSRLGQFISSFWIQRKWFLELKICTNRYPATIDTCFIQPLKKQWYELQDYTIDNKNYTGSNLTQQECIDVSVSRLHLIIKRPSLLHNYQMFEEYVDSIVAVIQFTNLHIDMCQFSISILLHFLYQLPNLDSLTIKSEFPEATKAFFDEQNDMFHFISTHNKITKISLEQMTELDQVHILMNLCPHMHYLQVKCRTIIDAEWLIPYVLKKQNPNFIPDLGLICIWLLKADDKITNNLQKIIDKEKLVENYTIKRICDRIYLRWN